MSSFINSFWGDVKTDDLEFVYSFTKRVDSATYACRIRRDSDNAETDIELESSGACDINSTVSTGGTLATWIGANNGFMVTDYDQTGNWDMTQSTAAKQAKIVNAGSWLGYKQYDGVDDIYFSSGPVLNTEGSVYIKASHSGTAAHYYLMQAEATSNLVLGFSTNSTSARIRFMDFNPTIKQLIGTDTDLSATNILTYRNTTDGGKHSMRVNSSNENFSVGGGAETDDWFYFYSGASETLQKGGLISTFGNLYTAYNEYEILGYSVEHTDAESASIEALM